MSTPGQKIRELRAKRGFTQQELANILSQCCGYKISRSTLGMWETDDRVPQRETLQAIGDLFGVSIDWILGREDDHTSAESFPKEVTLIGRASKKMTPEQRKQMLAVLKAMFPEEFDG